MIEIIVLFSVGNFLIWSFIRGASAPVKRPYWYTGCVNIHSGRNGFKQSRLVRWLINFGRKVVTVFLFSLLGTATQAQQYTQHSILADNGGPVYTRIAPNSGGLPWVAAPVVLVGRFSKPGQTTDDILTFQINVDGSASASCLTNNNDGTFNSPVVTSAFSAASLPFTGIKLLRAANPTAATDTVFIGTGTTLSFLHFSNCVPSTSSVGSKTPTYFSNLYVVPNGLVCGNATTSTSAVFGVVGFGVGIFNLDGGFLCQAGAFADFVATGPFNKLFPLTATDHYLFAQIKEAPPVANATAVINIVDYIDNVVNSFGTTNNTNLSGEIFLSSVFTPDGNFVVITSTGSQVFFDAVNFPGGPPTVTNIGAFTLTAQPSGTVVGNFWSDTSGSDIAISAGSSISVFTYVGSPGRPIWDLAETITASAPIQALATGNLSSTGDELIAQEGTNVEIFGSQSFTENAPIQYNFSVQVTGPGSVVQSPTGSTFNRGTQVTLTATAAPGTGASLAWSGVCSGQGNLCDIVVNANMAITATFTLPPAATPSLTATPPSSSVTAGNSAAYSLTPSGFSSTPTLSVSGCSSISKATCQISATGVLTVVTTATVTTTTGLVPVSPGRVDWHRLNPLPILSAFIFLLCLYLLPDLGRKRLVFGLATCFVLVGCGSGSQSAPTSTAQKTTVIGTPAGFYSLTTTASAGSATAQATVTLQVQ